MATNPAHMPWETRTKPVRERRDSLANGNHWCAKPRLRGHADFMQALESNRGEGVVLHSRTQQPRRDTETHHLRLRSPCSFRSSLCFELCDAVLQLLTRGELRDGIRQLLLLLLLLLLLRPLRTKQSSR